MHFGLKTNEPFNSYMMKKYFSLLLIVLFAFTVISCDDSNSNPVTVDNDTYPVAYDITESFTFTDAYFIRKEFNNPLVASDVVLIYRQSGTDNGNPVWQSLPRTLYIGNEELDYDFDFTRNDILIRAGGTMDLQAQNTQFKNTYLNNQKFRIVIVPASSGAAQKAAQGNIGYDEISKLSGLKSLNVKALR